MNVFLNMKDGRPERKQPSKVVEKYTAQKMKFSIKDFFSEFGPNPQ